MLYSTSRPSSTPPTGGLLHFLSVQVPILTGASAWRRTPHRAAALTAGPEEAKVEEDFLCANVRRCSWIWIREVSLATYANHTQIRSASH
jgi:hypothetical protein